MWEIAKLHNSSWPWMGIGALSFVNKSCKLSKNDFLFFLSIMPFDVVWKGLRRSPPLILSYTNSDPNSQLTRLHWDCSIVQQCRSKLRFIFAFKFVSLNLFIWIFWCSRQCFSCFCSRLLPGLQLLDVAHYEVPENWQVWQVFRSLWSPWKWS